MASVKMRHQKKTSLLIIHSKKLSAKINISLLYCLITCRYLQHKTDSSEIEDLVQRFKF